MSLATALGPKQKNMMNVEKRLARNEKIFQERKREKANHIRRLSICVLLSST